MTKTLGPSRLGLGTIPSIAATPLRLGLVPLLGLGLGAAVPTVAQIIAAAAFTTINAAGPTYTCATGCYDDYNHVIKYVNQRRQRPFTIAGTVYQADLIEQSATNLLAIGTSERFGVSWTGGTGNPTITDAAAAGPPGDTDAASFIEGVANGEQSIRQSITKAASALGYVGAVYVKALSGTRSVVVELDDGTTTNGVSLIFNPITGAIVSAPAAFGAGWSVLTAAMPTGYSITDGGSGYWRVAIAATSDATTTIRLRVALYNGSTTSYAGNGTSGVYLWAASVCNCNWLCSHISSRNLISRSEDISGAGWTKTRSSATADSVANPLTAEVTADTLTEDATAGNTHTLDQSITKVASSSVTFSTMVRANGRTWVMLAIGATRALGNAAGIYFDISNGVVGVSFTAGAGWTKTGQAITSLGGGWYRCSVTVTTDSGTAASCVLRLASADNTSSYNGDGVSGVYVYGNQAQYGAITTYWATSSGSLGTRTAQLLLSTATLGTSQGTLLAFMLPYGWTGHFNNSTAYRIVSSQGTAADGEIRGATGGASNALACTRTDATPVTRAFSGVVSPGPVSGALLMPTMTWSDAMRFYVNGSGVSTSTASVAPWATVSGTSIGPNSGSGAPNAYVLGLASALALSASDQALIFANASAA